MSEWIVYRLTPPAGTEDEAFERFVRDEVFTAVHRGPTRVGAVEGMRLLRDESARAARYLWTVEWNGLSGRLNVAAALAKLRSAGARARQTSRWREVERA
jgi:hypothetical protein